MECVCDVHVRMHVRVRGEKRARTVGHLEGNRGESLIPCCPKPYDQLFGDVDSGGKDRHASLGQPE